MNNININSTSSNTVKDENTFLGKTIDNENYNSPVRNKTKTNRGGEAPIKSNINYFGANNIHSPSSTNSNMIYNYHVSNMTNNLSANPSVKSNNEFWDFAKNNANSTLSNTKDDNHDAFLSKKRAQFSEDSCSQPINYSNNLLRNDEDSHLHVVEEGAIVPTIVENELSEISRKIIKTGPLMQSIFGFTNLGGKIALESILKQTKQLVGGEAMLGQQKEKILNDFENLYKTLILKEIFCKEIKDAISMIQLVVIYKFAISFYTEYTKASDQSNRVQLFNWNNYYGISQEGSNNLINNPNTINRMYSDTFRLSFDSYKNRSFKNDSIISKIDAIFKIKNNVLLATENNFYGFSQDKDAILVAAECNGFLVAKNNFYGFSQDRDVVLAACSKPCRNILFDTPLRFVVDKFKNDKEIVLAAIRQNQVAIEHIGEELKKDSAFLESLSDISN